MIHTKTALFMGISWAIVAQTIAWQSPEPKGEQPIFFGTLKSREGNIFNVTNISVGRSSDAKQKIKLYEKPQSLAPSQEGNVLKVNPYEDLTTNDLELQKIKKITIAQPYRLWSWRDPESKRSVVTPQEFIEIMVTWRSGSTVPYLLELGPENTKRPVKLFCDVIDAPMKVAAQNGTHFCAGLKKEDLRKKGAPFPSIDSLELEEPCFKVPTENGGMVNSSQSS
jgi:hypothetical protein